MVRPMAKLKPGEVVTIERGDIVYEGRADGGLAHVRFASEEAALMAASQTGDVPLPPYIRRPDGRADEADRERYQTLFADEPGSCAAPTAGLHFSDDIFKALDARGIETARVTFMSAPAPSAR